MFRSRCISLVLLASLVTLFACGREDSKVPAVSFVQVTDLHLFSGETADAAVRAHQERLSRQAFVEALQSLRRLPEATGQPAFLVVTGDWGVESQLGAAPPGGSSSDQILAELLAQSPVRDIYFVPGTHDVVGAGASSAALLATRQFFDRVQKKLRAFGDRVELHDLTGCYFAPLGSCTADVPGTAFRLVGFPSHSFGRAQPEQEGQTVRLATLVQEARRDGKKALIVAHSADLDDPYVQAQERFAGVQRVDPKIAGRPRWSPWAVSPKVFARWREVVDSTTVAAVLAGNVYDSHRELYDPPYRWSVTAAGRADPEKIYLAPPLAVTLQDTSPLQARGLALFRAEGDHLSRRLYWYSPSRHTFLAAPVPKGSTGREWRGRCPGWTRAGIAWLWDLGAGGPGEPLLPRAAVFAIALLAAFLTAVQVWQIPPPTERPAGTVSTAQPAIQPDQPKDFATSLLTGNFARTVLSGLVGLAAVSFLDSFWQGNKGIQAKEHYLVLFVAFFLAILLLSAFFRGATEALRSRIVTWPGASSPESFKKRRDQKPKHPSLYRFWRWLFSWRTTLLGFVDTFFNAIQGKNQTQTKGFFDEIVELHRSIVRTADQVRTEIDHAIVRVLEEKKPKVHIEDRDVRVSVSLLAADGQTAFYVAREPGSLDKPFPTRSVAWLSINIRQALWCEQDPKGHLLSGYGDAEVSKIGEEGTQKLSKVFDDHRAPDYQAFLVLPFPWEGRAVPGGRRGAIHISFRYGRHMRILWDGLTLAAKQGAEVVPPAEAGAGAVETRNDGAKGVENQVPNFREWRGLLELAKDGSGTSSTGLKIQDPELHGVLHEALGVLPELFRYFNDTIYLDYVRPERRS